MSFWTVKPLPRALRFFKHEISSFFLFRRTILACLDPDPERWVSESLYRIEKEARRDLLFVNQPWYSSLQKKSFSLASQPWPNLCFVRGCWGLGLFGTTKGHDSCIHPLLNCSHASRILPLLTRCPLGEEPEPSILTACLYPKLCLGFLKNWKSRWFFVPPPKKTLLPSDVVIGGHGVQKKNSSSASQIELKKRKYCTRVRYKIYLCIGYTRKAPFLSVFCIMSWIRNVLNILVVLKRIRIRIHGSPLMQIWRWLNDTYIYPTGSALRN